MTQRIFSVSNTSVKTLSTLLSCDETLHDLGSLDRAECLKKEVYDRSKTKNFVVRYGALPWHISKTFILKMLMGMAGKTLFVEPPSRTSGLYYPYSFLLQEMADMMRHHSFGLSPNVRLGLLVRSSSVEYKGRTIGIPLFSEAEKMQLELELSPWVDLVFVEEGESLLPISECLQEALLSRRSLASVIKEKRADFGSAEAFLKLYDLENSYLTHRERFTENDRCIKQLEEFLVSSFRNSQ